MRIMRSQGNLFSFKKLYVIKLKIIELWKKYTFQNRVRDDR